MTTSLLLLFLLAPAAPRCAPSSTPTPTRGAAPPQTALEKKMRGELMCMCGDCPHYS